MTKSKTQPLDQKERINGTYNGYDVKSSLSNLKKRLKEENHYAVTKLLVKFNAHGKISEIDLRELRNEIKFTIPDKLFESEIGKGLLEDNDE